MRSPAQRVAAMYLGMGMTHREQRNPADMIAYLKEHGIFKAGGDVVRINGDQTYNISSVKVYRGTGIRLIGRDDFGPGSYESWDIVITPTQAIIKTVSLDDGFKDENVEKISTIQILGAP